MHHTHTHTHTCMYARSMLHTNTSSAIISTHIISLSLSLKFNFWAYYLLQLYSELAVFARCFRNGLLSLFQSFFQMVPAFFFILRNTRTFMVLNGGSTTVLQVPYLESQAAMVSLTFLEKKKSN